MAIPTTTDATETNSQVSESVEAYWQLVYGTAVSIVRNHDDAVDVTQTVFIKLFRKWDSIRDKTKLPGWLKAAARTSSFDALRVRRKEPVEFHLGQESVTWMSGSPCPPTPFENPATELMTKERIQEIRRCVEAVDTQYSEVIRLYYFDNLKVSEIAYRLAMPVGTIKWRLSKAREMLKEELEMSEIAENTKDNPQFPRLYVDTIWGYKGPEKRLHPGVVCKSLLAQQVLLAVRKEFRTEEEIVNMTKADSAYVSDCLQPMVEAEVVQKKGRAYRANCILFDAEDEERILTARRAVGDKVASIVADHIGDIDRVGIDYHDRNVVRWICIGIFLLNNGIRRGISGTKPELSIQSPSRPDGGSWVFLPRLQDTAIPVEMGCNSYDNGNPDYYVGIAEYWNSDFRIVNTRQRKAILPIAELLLDGPVATASLLGKVPEDDLAAACELGYVDISHGIAALNIPVFTPSDGELIDATVKPIVGEIIERAIPEFPDDVYRMFDSLGFSFIKEDYAARAHTLCTLGALRFLSEMGVLKVPPGTRPVSWGVFAFKGKFDPMVWEG